jgi:type IV pilus assembly protein PilM
MTAFLDLGWTAAVALIVKSDTLIYERRIPEAGLAALVKALAEHSEIEPRDAEYLLQRRELRESTSVASSTEREEDCSSQIAGHCGKMTEELRQSFSYARHQYPDCEMPTLLLTGGGCEIPGLAQFLEKELQLEVRIAEPFAAMEHAGAPSIHSLVTAVGLAQFGTEVAP